MISAFDVYLVMQMDELGRTFAVIGWLAVAMSVLCFIGWCFCASANPDEWNHEIYKRAAENRKAKAPYMLSMLKRAIAVEVVMFAICSFIPSTKTVAAMMVLPAVTSDRVVDAVTPEFKELLGLTKDALRAMGGNGKKPDEPR